MVAFNHGQGPIRCRQRRRCKANEESAGTPLTAANWEDGMAKMSYAATTAGSGGLSLLSFLFHCIWCIIEHR